MPELVPGQRWISSMEPELGLGIVIAVSARTVTLWFPAVETDRVYALAGALLERVILSPGDEARPQQGAPFTVEEVTERDGVLVYCGGGRVLPESQLDDSVSVSGPQERLRRGEFDRGADFDLRVRGLEHQSVGRKSSVRGFRAARIRLVPHQLYVAQQVAALYRPRVLLSDETGLGKTIEAGLILQRLLVCGRIDRVLILVPEPLVHQWLVELRGKFNLCPTVFGPEFCESTEGSAPAGNPFLAEQIGIASHEFLLGHPARRAQAVAAGWHMLVVDEAHHLLPGESAYEQVHALAQAARGLLLLTATPEQLGLRNHFARLRLLDSARYHDFARFEQEEALYMRVSQVVGQLLDGEGLTERGLAEVRKLSGDGSLLADCAQSGPRSALDPLVQAIVDRHGTGRAIFRNTRASVAGFSERAVDLVRLPAMAPKRTRADGLEGDPRVGWLVERLRSSPEEKFVLLCRTTALVQALAQALVGRSPLAITLFHDGLSPVEMDRGVALFARPGVPGLLICSELGSEGRNFQFARHLILFDLPRNPELLEQRIGRLDRIGQPGMIRIYVPYRVRSEEEVLARWFHDGLDAFRRNVPGAHQLYLQFRDELERAISDPRDDALDRLVERTREFRIKLVRRVREGRDRLLEFNSNNARASEKIISQIFRESGARDLENYMVTLFEAYGITVEDHGPRTYRLNASMLTEPAFPITVDEDAEAFVTFDHAHALRHGSVEYLSHDHPWVTGALEMLLGTPRGTCGAASWRDPARCELMVEAVYVLECLAPPKLYADRFLPPTPIRVVIDQGFADASSEFPRGIDPRELDLERALPVVKTSPAHDGLLPAMLDRACEVATGRAEGLIDRCLDEMRRSLGVEIDRLVHLGRVNPRLPSEELQGLREEVRDLEAVLGASRLRLDAVRVVGALDSAPP